MQRKLLDILACPIDKHYPLELLEFSLRGADVIVDGVLLCSECGRYYPIMDEIPVMLPDNLRNRKEDLGFLERWSAKLPEKVVHGGKPWSMGAA
ncbi:MAG TPA: Trm112 family protein [Nitrososphaerales archaeon]|nr:Trm112 family protein [Nitrososphaerales archaeon]